MAVVGEEASLLDYVLELDLTTQHIVSYSGYGHMGKTVPLGV